MSDDNPNAYKPAPGDATAKTKPSVHTKKFKAMYGEDYSKGLDGKKLKANKEDMLIDPKKMAKKTTFLSVQNKDKLKTDLATLKKKLGPDHPLNKPKAEACWSGYKQVGMKKKGGKDVPNCVPENVDLEEKKKKLTKAQKNKKMRAADRARDRRIRRGNPFNVQT